MRIKGVPEPPGFIGRFSSSGTEKSVEPYVVLPLKGKTRWIMPLHNKEVFISSLSLYQPSLLRAKLLKRITVILARLGVIMNFVDSGIHLNRSDEEIKRIFKKDDLYYAVFAGSEGTHRKLTVQVMDRKGVILGYIKVSDNEEVNTLLQNEARILEDLSKLEINRGLLPKVIYHGEIKETRILIQDTLKGANSTFSSRLSLAHIDFIAEIFHKSAVLKRFGESDFRRCLGERISAIKGKLARELLAVYQSGLDAVDRLLGYEEMPFGLCHRDFTPWNTFFNNGKIYAFDWEYARRDYPPLMDVFHFLIQDGIQVRKLNREKLLKKVMLHWPLITRYIQFFQVDKKLVDPLLLCYLLDISLLYIERENGNIEDSAMRAIETWCGMMDLIKGRL